MGVVAMDKKVEAAYQGQGVIELEDSSAEAVKKAVEAVSDGVSVEDNLLTFDGKRIIEGHGFALQVNSFDIYKCARGYLLHTYMDDAPNWAVSGRTVSQMLHAAPDQRVAKRAHGLMVQKGLASFHDH